MYNHPVLTFPMCKKGSPACLKRLFRTVEKHVLRHERGFPAARKRLFRIVRKTVRTAGFVYIAVYQGVMQNAENSRICARRGMRTEKRRYFQVTVNIYSRRHGVFRIFMQNLFLRPHTSVYRKSPVRAAPEHTSDDSHVQDRQLLMYHKTNNQPRGG